ncbi:Isopentenyl-diphosphate Delta-isomerase [Micromonospora saelicesensis]|uniref:Isopentenyl-diphosphate Delta-isomerase n=1 Tax=Micromonospora saelicesensis TaxID=285676 RepID=A0A328NNQ0_9ACTN|nr:isopentenyl-diphosphate Delta-isomerase [Micromonospora saelicesensis]RAO29507.1 Isopentenyl-diphosphate Delta-isomerase [Micromonospora saelicesensis]
MSSREKHLVELVDETGKAHGETTVAAAHQPPGQLHRAFSVLLVDPDGQVLLQRRAAVKTRFPLRWANSCCGHPQPGESLAEAANRRLSEELGAGPVELTEVGIYVYYAEDPATGRVEFEYDHVLRGEFLPGAPLLPDQDEVAELRWADPTALEAEMKLDPRSYAPWLGGVVNRLLRPAESRSGETGPAMTPPGSSADDTAERSGGR